MEGNAPHPTLRQKGANAMFKVRNDVHHGRRPMGVASIVRGIPVEELDELVVLEAARVEPIERAQQGKGPNLGQQAPCRRRPVGAPFV